MPVPAPKDHYTFADCLTWGENERIEIINGEAVMMAPPTRIHQEILMELSGQRNGSSVHAERQVSSSA